MRTLTCLLTFCSGFLLSNAQLGAQDIPGPTDKKIEYSPYPRQDFPNQVFFGDTHLHTSYSSDAGMVGCILSPEDAYRFAMGKEVVSSTGVPARLNRPLDFLVVADHAENLGLAPAIAVSDPNLLKNAWGKEQHDLVKSGPEGSMQAFDNVVAANSVGDNPLADNPELMATYWKKTIDAAEKYNSPGHFTAFIGYEWGSMPGGNNLHRNVIFRDGGDKAEQVVPFSLFDSSDPEDLWKWMEAYEKKTGGRLLAIPHNGNLSNGLMFDDKTFTGDPLSDDYAKRRMKWEPLYEVTQMKGDGEAHPMLSANDEFADYETWDGGSFGPQAKTKEMLPKEYAREAWKRGLAYEAGAGHEPVQVRRGRIDRLPHRLVHRRGRQLLRQGHPPRAVRGSDPLRGGDCRPRGSRWPPVLCQPDCLGGPGRRLGAGKHPGSALGRDEAQGGLCDHRHPHPGADLRRLRLLQGGSGALRLRQARLRQGRAHGR